MAQVLPPNPIANLASPLSTVTTLSLSLSLMLIVREKIFLFFLQLNPTHTEPISLHKTTNQTIDRESGAGFDRHEPLPLTDN